MSSSQTPGTSKEAVEDVRIPERKSSKRKAPATTTTLEKDLESTVHEAKHRRTCVKAQTSFDAAFWTEVEELKALESRCTELRKQISIRDFMEANTKRSEDDWSKSADGIEMLQRIQAVEAEKKLVERQKQRLSRGTLKSTAQRVFLKLFTSSKLGLGLDIGGLGRRSTTDQTNFRKEIIAPYGVQVNPDDSDDGMWCCITGREIDTSLARAAHLFPYAHGQDTMLTIFGKDAENELFSPLNGLLIEERIERCFDIGLFAIVPDIDDMSAESIAKWNSSSPKNYKLRILNEKHPKAGKRVFLDKPDTWLDWDGRKLKFKNDFRPRARYLYFHYCCQILRYAWSGKKNASTPMMQQLGKGFWGTPGRYLPRNMLAALVEERGHEYDSLMEGADNSGQTDENDDVLLSAMASQVQGAAQEETDEGEDDSD